MMTMPAMQTQGTLMSRHLLRRIVWILCAASLMLTTSTQEAHAQEVQVTGPLAGAPAVKGLRLYRDGRFQLKPFIGFTLQDKFTRTIMFGAEAHYHFFDWLGLGLWFGYGGVHINTDLTDEIRNKGQTTNVNALSLPSRENFDKQISELQWALAAQVTFIPLRGKLALFQTLFVDTDFYIFAGAAIVGVQERANIDESATEATGEKLCSVLPTSDLCLASQTRRKTEYQPAPTFGIGLTVYFNDFVGLSLEWRALPFKWNPSGTDERGNGGDFPDGEIDGDDAEFQFNHMFNLGVVFYLPTEVGLAN